MYSQQGVDSNQSDIVIKFRPSKTCTAAVACRVAVLNILTVCKNLINEIPKKFVSSGLTANDNGTRLISFTNVFPKPCWAMEAPRAQGPLPLSA